MQRRLISVLQLQPVSLATPPWFSCQDLPQFILHRNAKMVAQVVRPRLERRDPRALFQKTRWHRYGHAARRQSCSAVHPPRCSTASSSCSASIVEFHASAGNIGIHPISTSLNWIKFQLFLRCPREDFLQSSPRLSRGLLIAPNVQVQGRLGNLLQSIFNPLG